MTSRTGNKKGFTLVEVLVAVSILSLGAVFIYQGNMMALDVYGRYVRRLSAQNWAEEKIWQAKEEILGKPFAPIGETSGVFTARGRDYRWQLSVEASELDEFYSIALEISWKEGSRDMSMERFSFVRKPTMTLFG
jgi:prepilin-type N-terminal cleavage/methylation domain-containing protein